MTQKKIDEVEAEYEARYTHDQLFGEDTAGFNNEKTVLALVGFIVLSIVIIAVGFWFVKSLFYSVVSWYN